MSMGWPSSWRSTMSSTTALNFASSVLKTRSGWSIADHLLVGRDGHHGQAVGGGELAGLGLGRAGHAGQLLVHAEVVLQRHRGPGVVLLLDGHPLLRLDRLVEAVGPAPALERAPGELVDDLHLAVGDEVVLVPLVEVLGRQRLGQLVDVVDRDGVVDVLDPDRLLHLLDPGLERDDRLLLLVDLVVARRASASGRWRRTGSRAGPPRRPGPR